MRSYRQRLSRYFFDSSCPKFFQAKRACRIRSFCLLEIQDVHRSRSFHPKSDDTGLGVVHPFHKSLEVMVAPQIAPPILRKVNWIQSAKEDRRHREITREILTFIPLKLRDVPARNLLDPTSFYSIDRARIKLEIFLSSSRWGLESTRWLHSSCFWNTIARTD